MYRAVLATWILTAGFAWAQPPEATPEHKYLQKLAGMWDAAITISGAPEPMKGTFEVKKLGDHWILTTLKANFGPIKYEGHGTKGYDPRKKKFVGAWADNITDSLAVVEGTLDEKSNTITETWKQTLPNGSTLHFKIVTTRSGDDKLNAVYHSGPEADQMREIMKIEYTRSKAPANAK